MIHKPYNPIDDVAAPPTETVDADVERGLPLDLNVRKKSTLTKVAFLGVAMLAAAAVVFGLVGFLGGSDDTAVKKEEDLIGNTAVKNFANDKAEIADQALDFGRAEAHPPPETTDAAPVERPQVDPATLPYNRRLSGDVMVDTGRSGSLNAAVGGDTAARVESGSDDGGGGGGLFGSGGADSGSFARRLQANVLPGVSAMQRGNTDLLLIKGTNIPCVTETRIITTHPGLTRCTVANDVYSANGKTVLIERGSKISGEQTAALVQGQARVFALWNEVETPKGVKVSLASPGAGALGESGHSAYVNYHFWQRFGGAIMISLISDVSDNLSNRQKSTSGNNNTITYENSSDAAKEMATEALKNSINIPPTGTVNQGSLINIMVARDVDFSKVYELVRVPHH